MQDRLRVLGQYRPTRRELLIGTSTFVVGGVLNRLTIGPGSQAPDVSVINAAPVKENPDRLINEILATPPLTDGRRRLERQYLGEISREALTLSTIDKGFWVVTEPLLRAELLDARYLKQKTNEGLPEIPKERASWAQRELRVHPGVLEIAWGAYPKARKIIADLIKVGKLRDDGTEVTPDEVMINPGGMTALILYETGEPSYIGSRYAFTNIGGGLSVNEINTSMQSHPRGVTDLETLCLEVSRDTGYTFQPNKIVGSIWPEKKALLEEELKKDEPNRLIPEQIKERLDGLKSSGGAISIQFMPENALKIYNLVKSNVKDESGKPVKLNIFDVTDATIMAYIFLALHEKGYPRYGYRRGILSDQINALHKWNQNGDQINTILEAAIDYYAKFILDKPEGSY